jgi:hypothetical protein
MSEEDDMRDMDLVSEGVSEEQQVGTQQILADADGDEEEDGEGEDDA